MSPQFSGGTDTQAYRIDRVNAAILSVYVSRDPCTLFS